MIDIEGYEKIVRKFIADTIPSKLHEVSMGLSDIRQLDDVYG